MVFEKYDNRNDELILAISLGSKSSAMLTRSNGNIIGAYKEEHFTGIKNDSSFPVNSVIDLLNQLPDDSLYQITIAITHWFNSKNSNKTWERYYTDVKDLIKTVFKDKLFVIKKIIEAHDLHDCLSETARCNILSNHQDIDEGPITVIVANRFGNFENVASTYKWNDKKSFIEGQEPEINKLKDFKSSIGMMQQIGSRMAGYLEYDINRSLLNIDNDYPIQKITSSGLSLYGNQKDWIKYDRFNEQVLFALTETSREENINRAIRKSKDIYDYRPLNVKKLDMLNDYYIDMFSGMSSVQIMTYIQNKSYQALSKLIKPHIKGNVVLIGDVFSSKKINKELRKLSKKEMIISPLLEDNSAIFGATNKILEKIYYNTLNLKTINIVNRNIRASINILEKIDDYKTNMSPEELKKEFISNVKVLDVSKDNSKDLNSIVSGLLNGHIYNFIFNKGSFSEAPNFASVSISIADYKESLMSICSDNINRESYDLEDSEYDILNYIKNACYTNRLICVPFVNNDNITPLNEYSCFNAVLQQIEKREYNNLSNDINLIIIK